MSNEASWRKAKGSEQLRMAWDALKDAFPPNPYKYGVLKGYDDGRKDVSTVIINEDGEPSSPLDAWASVLAKHFQAEDIGRVGYLAGSLTGTTVGCIDIDKHIWKGETTATRDKVVDAALGASIAPLLERSTSGGWHIWIFCRQEVPYETMRDALRHIVSEADVGVLEVYPMGSAGPRGRWVFMPYAGVAKRPDGLGRTYLETTTPESIPIWDLVDAVDSVATTRSILIKLQERHVKAQEKYKASQSAPGELSDEALEQLRATALEPPDGFDRHHSAFAFINLAQKAGRGRGNEMREYLATQDVYDAWIASKGGGRSMGVWREELERIWETVREASDMEARRFGIPFLSEQGWEVPELDRKLSKITVAKGWSATPDDDLAARWLSQQLEDKGSPIVYDQGTPFLYRGGTWFPLNGTADATRIALEKVLRPEGAKISAQKTTARIRWMLESVVARPLVTRVDKERIAVANGLLNLRQGRLEPFDQGMVTLGRAPVHWERISREREDELLAPLRTFLRTAMFDHPTEPSLADAAVEDYFRAWAWVIDPERRGRYFLDFHGPTSTGKSTAVKVALSVLGDVVMGDELGMMTSLDVDALDVQEFTVALIGRTGFHFDDLAMSGDRRTDRRIVNFLKKISSGATVNINRKYMSNERALIQARAVVSTNGILTASTEDTEALNVRAWRLGFFGRKVPREEQIPFYERALLPTEEHRLALLRCFVRYWQELDANQGRRVALSARVQTAVFEGVETLQYPVLLFALEQLRPAEEADRVSNETLVRLYNEWALRHGERRHGNQSFGEAMRHAHAVLVSQHGWQRMDRAVYKDDGRTVRGWSGVKLADEPYGVVFGK